MKKFIVILLWFLSCNFGFGQARVEFEQMISRTQEHVFPAVVFVKPIQEEYDFGEKRKVIVYGSGVIISPEGMVVTNNHVVEHAVEIRCVLSDRCEVAAKLVGRDEETDLALLKLVLPVKKKVPFVSFGDSDKLKSGEFVLAMGAPFGFVRSVSLGIVSNTRRYLSMSPYNLWIQTDAAINPGNSGGPLINVKGEIVGINSRGISMADNIGFAIPSNRVREVVDSIRKHKKVLRSWTGLQFQPLKDFEKSFFFPADEGVLVSSVDRNSPAEIAGLKTGDRIISVNGGKVQGLFIEDLPAIRRFFSRLPPGKSAEIKFVHNGKALAVSLTPARKGKVEGGNLELKAWDLTVKEINKYTDRGLAYFCPSGVFVKGVKYDGNGESSGFESGDVFLEIDGEKVIDLASIRMIYLRLDTLPQGRRKVLCKVLRNGYEFCLALDFNRQSRERLSGHAEKKAGF